MKLSDTLELIIELFEKKVRLIVRKNGDEWVCRKENVSSLKRFLNSESSRLFNGRLQLILKNSKVEIEVKGTVVGEIPVDYFRQTMARL
ncbi:hypothetical protein [Larkinella rosea]|uniref:Uncharacterized protein n=1 Tax=Larkinella rosea TaxID=2025312 RepID=A0A3P1C2K9_9BACT|nr:hypothetical protein [Larkinella rosea]RRB07615.1 hypothetical protein EHT25_07495 [Larkinella rosea]